MKKPALLIALLVMSSLTALGCPNDPAFYQVDLSTSSPASSNATE